MMTGKSEGPHPKPAGILTRKVSGCCEHEVFRDEFYPDNEKEPVRWALYCGWCRGLCEIGEVKPPRQWALSPKAEAPSGIVEAGK